MISDRSNMRWRGWKVHEWHAGKVSVNYFIHFRIGADLEKLWKLLLNFDQGALRRDFENERGVAKQRAVADRRNEGILPALDDLKTNSAPAKLRTQEILDVAN